MTRAVVRVLRLAAPRVCASSSPPLLAPAPPAPPAPVEILLLCPPVRAARGVSSLTASSWGSTPMARSVNGDLPSSSLYIELPFFVALEAPIVLSDAVFG